MPKVPDVRAGVCSRAEVLSRGSVCKSSLVTGKRPEPDRTRTCQDRKLVGLIRTITVVRSMVHHKFKDWKTTKRLTQPVLTGLFSRLWVEIRDACSTIQ